MILKTQNLDLILSIIRETFFSPGDNPLNKVEIVYDYDFRFKAEIEVGEIPFDDGEYEYPVMVKMVRLLYWDQIKHEYILGKAWSDFYEWDYGDDDGVLKDVFPDIINNHYDLLTYKWDEFAAGYYPLVNEFKKRFEITDLPFCPLCLSTGPVSHWVTGHRWNTANNYLTLTFEVCCTSKLNSPKPNRE